MKRFYLPLFFFLIIAGLSAQSGIEFTKSWETAVDAAASTDKLIFLDAYTTWCGPCKKLSREVFSAPEVGGFYNENFVNLKLDMEKGKGLELSKRYEVEVYPTLLFLDPFGNIVHRSAGYHDVPQFLALGETALDPENNLSGLERRYQQGERSAEFLSQYALARFEAMDASHEPIAEEYLQTQEDLSLEINLQFIFAMVESVDSKLFSYLRENKQKFDILFGSQAVTSKIENIIYSSVYALGEAPNLEKVDAIFEKAYPQKAEEMSAKYRLRYFLEQDDIKAFSKAAVKYFRKYDPEQPGEYNDIAWTFYELVDKRHMLRKAVRWTKKSIKIQDAYYNNDTLAALYYKMGKKRRARKAAEKAIEIAKATGEDPTPTEELLKEIEAM